MIPVIQMREVASAAEAVVVVFEVPRGHQLHVTDLCAEGEGDQSSLSWSAKVNNQPLTYVDITGGIGRQKQFQKITEFVVNGGKKFSIVVNDSAPSQQVIAGFSGFLKEQSC